MAEDAEVFDAARVPLEKGISLVEASAGTGKTYAIGMLVLRGVVELGIPIAKILIVTFTKAATEELKSRIRLRLAEARNLLAAGQKGLSSQPPTDVDATMLAWLSGVSDVELAIQRLQLALYDIDNASIFTIHSFCQRMLVDQALESGQLFNVELVTSIDHIIGQVVDDFWRKEVYPLDPFICSLLVSSFETPEKLGDSVSQAFRNQSDIEPEAPALDTSVLACTMSMESLQKWWVREGQTLQARFQNGVTEKHFKKWLCDNFEHWFAAIEDFVSGTSFLLPDNIEFLSYEHLIGELNGTKFRGDKKQAYLEQWTLPSIEVETLLLSIKKLLLAVRCTLASKRLEVSERLLLQGTMGFDGLIQNLAHALDGEKGRQLRQVIGDRFSLALIDEFQDTDSLQYKIFSELFGGGNHYLYLIGDPKQAIYKFRGADIHSYFTARNNAEKRLTLTTNYRSHPRLVEEVNRLFSARTNPFLYDESMLDYQRVEPGLSDSSFDIKRGGESLAGMVYCSLPENVDDKSGRWSSGKAADLFRDYSVNEILSLLNPHEKSIYCKGGKSEDLAPGDIAILVRSHKQAQQYQASLIESGIPAVVSSRSSVFHTGECLELMALLRAIASPTDLLKLKAAMAVSWFNFSGNQLVQIWQDEDQLSHWQSKMVQYHSLWLEQGLFSMMASFIEDEEILLSIAGKPYAERTIANLYHLIELIQEQESGENLGIGQLLQWLQKVYLQKDVVGGTELLLESDEDAVQIVTMHGAKGLEYPVVFCPYLWYSSGMLAGERHQITVNEHGRNLIDLGSELFEERKKLADYDQKAEELRLLYVALTRAKVRCYTMWGDVKKHTYVRDSFESPLGYLLFNEGQCEWQAQNSVLGALSSMNFTQHYLIGEEEERESYSPQLTQGELVTQKESGRSLGTSWQMTSFSGLATMSEYEYEHNGISVQRGGDNPIPVPGLPAGASFGNVIHDLLEDSDFSSLESSAELLAQIEKKCSRYGVETDSGDIAKLLRCIVSTNLTGEFSLQNIAPTSVLKEMPFYFKLSPFQTAEIHKVLAGDPTVLPMNNRSIRGYLTGFVDLICLINGKYYVMDYKTNILGENMDAYSYDNLVEAMKSHNYGLQYWIYSLVLHHHLMNLMDDYDFNDHFGGVMYLFVRGMSPDITGSGVYSTVPDYGTLLRLSALLADGGHDE
ncbi:exodeoxyribonuclease V subunit beta [Desulforhopalus sp. 52FAK]